MMVVVLAPINGVVLSGFALLLEETWRLLHP